MKPNWRSMPTIVEVEAHAARMQPPQYCAVKLPPRYETVGHARVAPWAAKDSEGLFVNGLWLGVHEECVLFGTRSGLHVELASTRWSSTTEFRPVDYDGLAMPWPEEGQDA